MDDLLKMLDKELKGEPQKKKGAVRFTHEVHEILEIIEHLEAKIGQNVPEEDIIKKAKEEGIPEEETKQVIEELIRDNAIYRPHYMKGIVRMHGITDYTQWSHDFPI